jgi:hypothetical protein
MSFLLFTALAVSSSLLCSVYGAIPGLEFDENRRLNRNSILIQDTAYCRNKIDKAWKSSNLYTDARNYVPMTPDVLQSFVNSDAIPADTKCAAVCVDTGLEESLISYPLPFYTFSEKSSFSDEETDKESELREWSNSCRAAEVGFVSYYPHEVQLYWINAKGDRHDVGQLRSGERFTIWQKSFLGHTFEIWDLKTNEMLHRHVVMHHAHVVVGHEYHAREYNRTVQKTFDFKGVKNKVKQAMSSEWDKCHRVTRTFTPLGFSKGRLPNDVWGSISAYNYNNKKNVFAEEWTKGNKGYFVNWWEVTPYMIGIPWTLKRYWQTRMRDMVAKWIGGDIPLENTDIYGIRRYEDGARLLTHVDREATHAVSMIVNIDQVGMREPWMVEIYDFGGRLHEVEMSPGEVVYYESAKALHGRMKPLQGTSYSNLFTHYRPVSDPQWSTRPNPANTPDQIKGIDHCKEVDGVVDCDGVKLPFLSPSKEVLRGPHDLFSYWERITEKIPNPPKIGGYDEL